MSTALNAANALGNALPGRRRASRMQRVTGAVRSSRAGIALPIALVGGAAAFIASRRRSAIAGAVGRARNPQSDQAVIDDDQTLQQKVETEIFRDPDVPKGDILVNAEHGRVVLRGEIGDAGTASALEAKARTIPGVRDVENLLHAPGTPAPPSEPAGSDEARERATKPKSRFSRNKATAAAADQDTATGTSSHGGDAG